MDKDVIHPDDDITKWGDLGLKGEWVRMPINLYGRNSASGTYGYFKEHVLFKGDYKDSVKEQPGSAAVVNAIAGAGCERNTEGNSVEKTKGGQLC
jgi:ABC-type phosphate transport system substrate-binding protein